MGFIILFLIFAAVLILVLTLVPMVANQGGTMAQNNASKFLLKYDSVLAEDQIKKTYQMMVVGPVLVGVVAFLFAPEDMKTIAVIGGVILGVIGPRMRLNQLIAQRKEKFTNQLMDALMIMSSSFRGGLSLIQAIEAVVDEMPDPAKQEFGIVLGENKMGVSLDDSLHRLYKRMPSPALQQMMTAILLARETGGNLALIFSRIISTMRERKKIEQNLKTLTIQGRIQAAVMTGLPILFYLGVSASNPQFFDIMRTNPTGQKMLVACLVMWILGALTIWKISKFKDI